MLASRTTALMFALALTVPVTAGAQAPTPPAPVVQIDPISPLDSRVGDTDPSVLKMFADAGMGNGSSNWHDDVAELLAWHHLTNRMGQPYRLVVREGGTDVLVYEPRASPLVQSRLRLLTPLYEASTAAAVR